MTDKNENIIKQTCKELGITQKALAEAMGVGEQTVSSWARGINEIPVWAFKMFELMKQAKEEKQKDEVITNAIKLLKTLQK